ncbi:hypothetical protein [Bradyrhizobium yuanmingense]|uniref:hypothetical protein n=1 Tax=Bradyrhizobium yuanmingense TaxID=108015 RepID=UPI0011A398C3|nr:hypothetical protein [Bradyrhizobium yuanmingense]
MELAAVRSCQYFTLLLLAAVAAVGMWATRSIVTLLACEKRHIHSLFAECAGDTCPPDRHRRAVFQRLMGALEIVQQGSRTPTGPFFARFFIDIIPGLVAEFAFMEGSRRLMMSLYAALLMDRKRIDGWRFQHGCSIEQHALTLNL